MCHQDKIVGSRSFVRHEVEFLVQSHGSTVLLVHVQQEQGRAGIDRHIPRFGNQVPEDLVRVPRRIIGRLASKPGIYGQLRDDQEVGILARRGRPAAASSAQRAEPDQLIVTFSAVQPDLAPVLVSDFSTPLPQIHSAAARDHGSSPQKKSTNSSRSSRANGTA